MGAVWAAVRDAAEMRMQHVHDAMQRMGKGAWRSLRLSRQHAKPHTSEPRR